MPGHNASTPDMQQMHPQQMHYQNGQVPGQVHYAVQPPPTYDQIPDMLEHQKSHGVKRRFSDVECMQVI